MTIKKDNDTKLPNKRRKYLFHPLSGLLTIAMDLTFFGTGAASLGLSTFLCIILAFLITALGVTLIHINIENETPTTAITKGLFLGIMAGTPLPIAGTGIGLIILTMAGLRFLFRRY